MEKLKKLSDRKLKSLKPEKKRYRLSIEANPGLYILVSTTGNITFQFRYQLRGVRREMKIGVYPARTLKNLLAEYQKLSDLVDQEIDPVRECELEAQKTEDNPLFKDFAERFISQHCKKKLRAATAREYERQIRSYFIPAWGKYRIADIQRKQIVKLIEKTSDTAPVQANRNLATIKKMFSYAYDVGVIETNPSVKIKPPAKETPRDRTLDLEEIRILFKILGVLPNKDTRDFLKLITLTAQRPGEVAGMRLSQLKKDIDGLWLELSGGLTTKNGEPTRIFLNSMAEGIIQGRIDDLNLTNFLFPAKTKSGHTEVTTMNDRTRKLQSQEIEYFTPHDLRRSATTGMARLGYGALADDLLNHKPKGVTRRVYDLYSRAPEIKRALMNWGETIERAVTGTGADIIQIIAK